MLRRSIVSVCGLFVAAVVLGGGGDGARLPPPPPPVLCPDVCGCIGDGLVCSWPEGEGCPDVCECSRAGDLVCAVAL